MTNLNAATRVAQPATALQLRPAASRGMADHGWLKSAHSFSFASYHDPEYMQFECLRVINDDKVAPGRGFGEHPHRDAEIFSYVLDGALEHRDSMGNGSTVTAGGVQYMSAGAGVRHSEFNPSATEPVHFLQVWLLPSSAGGTPRYATQQIEAIEKRGRLKLFLSPDGRADSIQVKANADVYAALLDGSESIEFDVRRGRRGWIQVARGSLTVNDRQLSAGDGLAIADSGRLHIHNGAEAELLLFDLQATT